MHLFLHGFLGQKEDWNPLFSHLHPSPKKVAIDLPGHGSATTTEDIAFAIHQQIPEAKFLVGYSAGGRIALELKRRFPKNYEKVILISAHPGLTTVKERSQKWEQDQTWIAKLTSGSFDDFLSEWYEQKLFSSLKKKPEFLSMIERRKQQNPHHLAHFLQTYSLSKKSSSEILPETICICGKEDLKYVKIYRRLIQINKIYTIESAGHALHLESPKELANILQEIFDEHDKHDRNASEI